MIKWCVQQCSCGVNVHGVELKPAANIIGNHMKRSFKACAGWLRRFCKWHGVINKQFFNAISSVPTEEIEPFRKTLHVLIDDEGLVL